MFINEDIVAIIFRIINFISVIGLGIFLFKKYVAADIWDMIRRKKDAHQALIDEQAVLEHKQTELNRLLKEESVLCVEIRVKIDTWKESVEQESALLAQKRYELKVTAAHAIAHRAVHKENSRVQTIVIDALIPELEESLSDYFHHKEHGTEYINALINFMDAHHE